VPWFWDFSWLGALFSILFWGGLIAVAVMLLRNELPNFRSRTRPPALDLLEERYARGEIDRQEFLERRAVLLMEPPSPSESSESPTPAVPSAEPVPPGAVSAEPVAPPPAAAEPAAPPPGVAEPVAPPPAAAEPSPPPPTEPETDASEEPAERPTGETEPTQPLPRKRSRRT
jgi:hypothetical protein